MSLNHDWIILAYTLPSEPSRKRVAIWRRLRKLGAVYLNEGFWFLPNTATMAKTVTNLISEVEHQEGTASAFIATDLQPDQKARLQARFNQARDGEYAELRRQCERFLAHVARESKTGNFDFSQVEELEEDLEKRVRLFGQIGERDVFGSAERETVERMVEECKEAMARYTEQAYEKAH